MANSFPNTTVRLQDNKSNSACASLILYIQLAFTNGSRGPLSLLGAFICCDTPLMVLFKNWVWWPCTSFKIDNNASDWLKIINIWQSSSSWLKIKNLQNHWMKWIEIWFREVFRLPPSEIVFVDRIHFPTWLQHSITVKQMMRLHFLWVTTESILKNHDKPPFLLLLIWTKRVLECWIYLPYSLHNVEESV